ncbi:peptide-methionine (R)-S-oxide reductase MsrB [Marivita sp.]|uniref:peptide-methionine (R)-S-oxide reductase MsrB n=1 Tax=Marivita sp. TaxID=2003365 RepID=UPI0025BF589D|nr:peptide-methionine (R)-S-oxide reductase MsrB [Marivita sp.]
MLRRHFLQSTAAILGLGAVARAGDAAESNFEVTRSEAEWKEMLNSQEYRVMREEGTERAYSSPLNDETRDGMFHCKGCDLALYASEHKYDSGTGWPSFWQAQDNAIGTKPDRSLFITRTECHCRRCGSHLGHIFDDGPQPTGKRHCINGVSLTFRLA